MALTLVKSPATVSLAGNDILFKVNTDNQYSSAGTKANLGLAWATGDIAGKSFTLTWGNKEVEFTSALTPNESGLQYPLFTYGTVIAWVESIVPYLRANYLLSKDFFVWWDSDLNVIQIQAHEKGADYSLTLDTGTSNVTEDSNAAGTDPVARDFYGIVCRVWLPGDGPEDYVLIGEDNLVPDEDGNVLFKIQEYLKPEVSSGFTYPEDPLIRSIAHPESIKHYFVEYAETYDGIPKKLYSTEATETYVIPGEVDTIKSIQFSQLEASFFDELEASLMFLSWHPAEKTISKWQPEKLYYLNFKNVSSYFINVRVTFTDGIIFDYINDSITSTPYEFIEICVGFNQLKLQFIPKEIDFYEVYLTNSLSERISETRKFILDTQYQEYERCFLFLNSLGAYETFRTTGIHSQTNEFEHELIDKTELAGNLTYTKQVNQHSWMDKTFTANSGWITKEVLDWTNDFIMSRDRFILENSELWPILVTSSKIFQKADNDSLFQIEFEYKVSVSARAYSKAHSFDVLLDETGDPILDEESKFIIA